ncbi:MAG: UPF0758 domain-containing protein, partial [Patescibacteria group bacterium]|nr:UPF0758 domain-containing protein [Patescibacteria group bacterium]
MASNCLQDLPKNYRPREKLIKTGATNLDETELIAILLGSGCKNRSVLELSNKIKQLWFQTNKKLSLPKLLRIKGIGQA